MNGYVVEVQEEPAMWIGRKKTRRKVNVAWGQVERWQFIRYNKEGSSWSSQQNSMYETNMQVAKHCPGMCALNVVFKEIQYYIECAVSGPLKYRYYAFLPVE